MLSPTDLAFYQRYGGGLSRVAHLQAEKPPAEPPARYARELLLLLLLLLLLRGGSNAGDSIGYGAAEVSVCVCEASASGSA